MPSPDVALCPHCGNRSPQPRSHSVSCGDDDYRTAYHLAQCSTCDEFVLYAEHEQERGCYPPGYEPGTHDDSHRVWPVEDRLSRHLPRRAIPHYQEAEAVRQRAPNSYANAIGRALEAVCKDRQAVGRDLAAKLQDLVAKGVLPSVLSEMADTVRAFRNLGSHEDDADGVTADDVEAIDAFFRAVVEYVYVAPAKLETVRKRLGKS